MSRSKTFKWNLIFQYVSIAITMISGVILVPFYLKVIPDYLYGAWLATGSILVWFSSVDPGISGVIQQKISQNFGARCYKNISPYVYSGLAISFLISIIFVILGFASYKFIPNITGINNPEDGYLLSTAFLMVVIGSGLSIISYTVVSVNQGLQNSIGIGIIYVIIHILDILLLLILLNNQYSLIAFGYSSIFRGLGMLVFNSLLMFYLLKTNQINKNDDFSEIGNIIKIIRVTAIERICTNLSSNYQPFIIAKFLNLEMVTIVAITKKIIDIAGMIITRPGSALTPSFSHAVGENSKEKLKAIVLLFLITMALIICYVFSGLILFNGYFIQLWVEEKYYIGDNLNLLLCAAMVVGSIVTILNLITNCYGNFKKSGLINILQNILTVGFGYLGCKYYGLFGLIALPMIPIIGIGIPYFLMQLKKNGVINSDSYRKICCEIAYSLVAVFIAYLVVKKLGAPENWFNLIVYFGVFSMVYFIVLILLSTTLRNIITLTIKKINS